MEKDIENINLIDATLKGDSKSFEVLYQKYKKPLFLICLRYAVDRDQAQDFLQDSFVNVFRKLKQFDRTKGSFGSWASRIAVNECLAFARKKTLFPLDIKVAETLESKDNSILSELSLKEMLKLIHSLPYGYRTIFNMYVIDGFSHKEIAEQMSISISTSKSQLAKARKALQKKILNNKKVRYQEHG